MNPTHYRKIPVRRSATLLAGLLFSSTLSAMTLVYEGFDIEPGELDFTSGETSFGWKIESGSQVDWFAWDEATIEPYHGVSDGGLDYPGLPSVGNAFVYTEEVYNLDNGNWAYRSLPKFYSYNSSGQFWLSALFNPKITGDPSGGGWIQLCLADTPNPGNQVYLGISNAGDTMVWSGGGERLYELDASGNPINGSKWSYSEVPVEDGVTAFLVMHLDLDNKTAAFYVNPPVDGEDPGEPVAEYTMLTDFYVNKIMMWSWNNGPSVEGEGADYIGSRIDEIRVGDSYTSVAAGADITDPGVGSVDFDPPLITGLSGPAGSASSTTEINENLAQVGAMTANETVSWSISGGIDGDLFSIGLGTGGLSFKVPPDFEAPGDSNADNRYIVSVTATDESGNEASQVVIVNVLDSTDEVAPVITGPSGSAGDLEGSISVNENTLSVATFSADETATWSISGEDRLLLRISESGELSFVTRPDFENPVDSGGDNTYIVNVKAADAAGNGSEQLFTITVLDVEPEEAVDAVPPVITGPTGSAGDASITVAINENSTEVGTFTADEGVTWAISGDDSELVSMSAGGVLSFVNAPDYESPSSAGGDNTYAVIVSAEDAAGNSSTQAVVVTVQDVTEGGGFSPHKLNVGAWNELAFSWVYGVSEAWGESNYMGSLYLSYYPTYVYQMDLGWLLYAGGSSGVAYFYSYTEGWILTGESYEGYYYVYASGTWNQFTLSEG